MTNAPVISFSPGQMSADDIFDKATQFDKAGYTMATGCCARKFGGLYGGHAYTLIGTKTVKKADGKVVRLMKIRNPWGTEVYKGPWCDSCSEWTPDTRAQAGMTNANDGVFHIPVEEYALTFNTWTVAAVDPEWNVAKATWNKPGQMQAFKIKAPADGRLVVTIDYLGSRAYTP